MRLSICNEMFNDRPFDTLCRQAAGAGFDGIELDANTVGDERALRRAIQGEGLSLAGFHWLFPRESELNLLHPDSQIRERSWDHLLNVTDQCHRMEGELLVLGSGDQRRRVGQPRELITRRFVEELARFIVRSEGSGVTLCLEPLPQGRSDFLNSLSEVATVIGAVDSPRLGATFDFHNLSPESWIEELEEHAPIVAHVHLNGLDGGFPDPQAAPFGESLGQLRSVGYGGWISLELFPPDPLKDAPLGRIASLLRSAFPEIEN